jgi:hypothetical protein
MQAQRLDGKSFLVLFFRKELLPSKCFSREDFQIMAIVQ